jgi:hypothetical protein
MTLHPRSRKAGWSRDKLAAAPSRSQSGVLRLHGMPLFNVGDYRLTGV